MAELDLSKIDLPEELIQRLMEAADIYDLTELYHSLDEMEGLGADERQLSEHLRGLVRNFEMDEIVRILSEIEQT